MGGEEIKDTIRDVLKDQAKYLETSQLYEILLATLKNEAANLAVIQSQNWEQVQFAKALHHVTYVIENIITKLSK